MDENISGVSKDSSSDAITVSDDKVTTIFPVSFDQTMKYWVVLFMSVHVDDIPQILCSSGYE